MKGTAFLFIYPAEDSQKIPSEKPQVLPEENIGKYPLGRRPNGRFPFFVYLGYCSNYILKLACFTRHIDAISLNGIGIAVKGYDSVEDVLSTVTEQDNVINIGGTVQRGKCDFILTVT